MGKCKFWKKSQTSEVGKYIYKTGLFISLAEFGLVNFQSYLDDLAGMAGIRPDYWKLFFDSPSKWYYAVTAAHNNCQFLLHDKRHHGEIFRRYRKYHGGNFREAVLLTHRGISGHG